MPFQPFGPAFEVDSSLPPEEVKARVRRGVAGWFTKQNGARGWILGPVVCLWWTALDPRGPMLVGWISPHRSGSRIVGRAGSDLNGVAWAILACASVIGFQLISAVRDLPHSGPALNAAGLLVLLVGGIWLIGGWLRQPLHQEAEPLVRFLSKTVTPGRRTTATTRVARPLTLTFNDTARFGPMSADDLHDALSEAGPDDVLILEDGPLDYIQTVWSDGGFILERRDGGADRHVRAEHADGGVIIAFDDVLAAFVAYAEARAMPPALLWKPLQLPD